MPHRPTSASSSPRAGLSSWVTSTGRPWLAASRLLLVELERRAVAADRRRLVLETGIRQPEAIGLYRSSGYSEIPRFGVYRCDARSRCFGKLLAVAAQPAR
jgi:hypothetical protein